MRKLMFVIFFALLFISACSQEPKTDEQKAFYSLGAQLSKQVSIFELTPEEMKYVQQGMSDASAGKKLAVDPDAGIMKLTEMARSRMAKAAEKQKELSKPYLEKAAKEQGAQKTASGLIYKEIKAGTGTQPKAADVIKFNYTGTFINGKQFDSSAQYGKPVEVPFVALGRVMPWLVEGIGMMKAGGKAKLVCPAELAFGEKGYPPLIPGNATLIYEVELLDVKVGAAAKFMMPPNAAAASALKAKARK